MLLSMTGHGESRRQQNGLAVAVEIRSINNKYFKLAVRGTDSFGWLEAQAEQTVRRYIRRGTVQIQLRVQREPRPDDFRLNRTVLESYRRQLDELENDGEIGHIVRMESLLTLPGVVDERLGQDGDLQAEWPVVESAIDDALQNLQQMREEEGRAMAADLRANCLGIREELDQIEQQAPHVAENYRLRLRERLNAWLSEYEIQAEPADILREVGLFAERSDISEEIVRLRSHLDQFDSIMQLPESSGRKLEFLTQEMFRETNTIGSKSNDVAISRHVIEIKAYIERIREMVQNVE